LQIIGSVVVWDGTVPGGSTYHIVFDSSGTTMNPYTDYDTVPKAASVDGTLPESANDSYDSITFQFGDIPAGKHTVFTWVDSNSDGLFNPTHPSNDLFGSNMG
jgi:hypothetical protein